MKKDHKTAWLRTTIIVAAIIAILIAALLISTRLILPRMIAAAVRADVAQRLESRLTFEHVTIDLLPRPYLKFQAANLVIDRTSHVKADEIVIAPSMRALIRGRIEPAYAVFRRIEGQVSLPAGFVSDGSAEKSVGSKASWSTLLDKIRSVAPDLVVEVQQGRLAIDSPSGNTMLIADIHAVADLNKMNLRITCSSNAWRQAHADLQLDPASLPGNPGGHPAGNLNFRIQALEPVPLIQWFPAVAASHVVDGRIDLDAQVTLLRQKETVFEADVNLSAPFVLVQRGGNHQRLEDVLVNATVRSDGAGWTLRLDRLSSSAPSLQLSADVEIANGAEPGARHAEVHAQIDHVAVEHLRTAVLSLAADIPAIERVAEILRGGTLSQASIETRSPTALSELGQPRRWQLTGRLEKGRLQIPGIDLPLRGVSADVRLVDGTLFGEQVTARTPGARAEQGHIILALFTGTRRFELNAVVDADLAQVLQRVRQWTALGPLQKLSRVSGRVQGRLVLGDNLKKLRVQVRDALILKAAARYPGLAHLLEIPRAKVSVGEGELAVADAHVIMGSNQLRGLAGKWSWQDAGNVQACVNSAEIVVQEMLPLLKRVAAPASFLKDAQGRGRIRLEKACLSLPPDGLWQIHARGRVNRLTVEDDRLPSPATVSDAQIEAEMDSGRMSVEFSGASVSMLDSQLSMAGRIHIRQDRLTGISLDAAGSLSNAAAIYIRDKLELPRVELARAAMRITRSELHWNPSDGARIQADLQYGSGPTMSLAMLLKADVIEIEELVIKDENSNVRITGRRQADEVRIGFQGTLDGSTLAHMFPALQAQAQGRLRGDFLAHFAWDRPQSNLLEGNLHARNVTLPIIQQHSIVLQDVAVQASQKTATITSGKIMLQDRPLELTGRVDAQEGTVSVDLLLKADSLSWQQIQSLGRRSDLSPGSPASAKRALLQGRVQFEVARFQTGKFALSPFNGTVLLRDSKVSVELADARLCGISLPGNIERTSAGHIDLALQPSAEDLLLSDTLDCLFDKPASITGMYDLQATLHARGAPDDLLTNLDGPMSFKAADGRIDRFGLLSRIFAFLSVTEIFAGKLPDLGAEKLHYTSLIVDGTFSNGRLEIETLDLDGPSVEIGSYGSVDFASRQLDLIVTVAPLKTIDRIIKKLPLVRTILGGNLLAIPVRVKGPIDDPAVMPLDPSAVGENLFNMLKRTFELPVKLFRIPSDENNNREDQR